MKNTFLIALAFLLFQCNNTVQEKAPELERWESRAEKVQIMRDNYGIAHIYGDSDADAVFGMIYAQCEDDFNRVEMNYITALGRLAQVRGEEAIFNDLRQKLFIDESELQVMYSSSEQWLKDLMDAWADGINFYLHNHPEVTPKVIARFEPWMALSFSEGSIGGDIESVSTTNLQAFYESEGNEISQLFPNTPWNEFIKEPRGSNGISIAPQNTEDGNTLFLINPHTSFFFRDELHVVSRDGLNAYGATTWGQFFIYQGFNENLGWMHTSSRADVIDYFKETVVEKGNKFVYMYDGAEKEVKEKPIMVYYKTEQGLDSVEYTGYFTHHGPVVSKDTANWYSVALMNKPLDALTQSYIRTKADDWDEFYEAMTIRTNSSNNTVYADKEGNIGYYHGNFMPRRNTDYDYSKPVDGSISDTDWQGLHEMEEMLILKNPENGWIQNCNSTPFTAAGDYSPVKEDYPIYMAPDQENYRGIHAVKVLEGRKDFTLDKLVEAAYDRYTPGFDAFVSVLVKAYERSGGDESMKEAIELLKNWDYRWGKTSVETTLAHFWGTNALQEAYGAPDRGELNAYDYVTSKMEDAMILSTFKTTIDELTTDFGTWKTEWADVNRYQRITGEIRQPFNDNEPSLGVDFVSGRWGSLASFGARKYPGTKKIYGTAGNSFVAFVEFGKKKVKAKSITAGGISGNPASDFFDNQAEMYVNHEFKEVNYYKADVERDLLRSYKPGQH